MFAIFLHESMTPFYQTITSFPTVIYTGLLLLCIFYWAIAVLGMVEVDFLDLDLDGDIDINEGADAQQALAGLLLKLGLHGVPLTIILTILSIIAWIICYYTSFYLAPILTVGLIKYPVGLVVFVVATYLAALKTVIVRSAVVTRLKGEAFMSDGGAGLLLNIRATGDEEFKKGDQVVLIEQINEQNVYRVVARSEFKG